MNQKEKRKESIHLSTREARAGNASHEHLVVAGAMIVIAALIVGVFIYAGLGEGTTKLGEPGYGPEAPQITNETSGQGVPGTTPQDNGDSNSANRAAGRSEGRQTQTN